MDYISEMGGHIDVTLTSSFDKEVDEVSIPNESTTPNCEGLPRRLWVGKCMVLHRANGVPMAKGIYPNVTPTSWLGP